MAALFSRTIRANSRLIIINSKFHTMSIKNKTFEPVQTELSNCFMGKEDKHNGIIVDSTCEPCTADLIDNRLQASLIEWTKKNKRTVWFRIEKKDSNWIPYLVREGFLFHHAKEHYVTLYKNLTSDNSVPPYAHTNLGVGAFVINEKTDEVLVIKEKYSSKWKLPGGYVEPGENIPQAAERELFEETGIRAQFKSLVGFRHAHGYAFECSDVYMVARLSPITFEINQCEKEVSQCVWMKLNEYINHPDVHKLNRLIATKVIENMKNDVAIGLIHETRPNSTDPIWLYLITKDNDFPH